MSKWSQLNCVKQSQMGPVKINSHTEITPKPDSDHRLRLQKTNCCRPLA